jgi:DNA modification methylase
MFIPLSSIFIPDNRQRREFPESEMNELIESIRLRGLFHPIVVSPQGPDFRLVAGERRLRAVSSLAELDIAFSHGSELCPAGSIPVTMLSDLSPLELREIELEENTIRLDLSWQDRVRAIADLNALRQEQNASHTISDTAREIFGRGAGGAAMKVQESILLSSELSDPDVAKAKSHSEAVKILTKKKAAAHRQQLASSISLSLSSHTLLEGDSRELLKTLPASQFACILTDPPYGINADSFGSQATTVHGYEDSPEYALSCYRAVAFEGFRVCTAEAHAYIFHSIEIFSDLARLFASAGWTVWPRPLIWAKGNGMLPRPQHGPRYTYEAILFATKGDRPVLLAGASDVIPIPPPADKLHAAEKPVDLLSNLLRRTCSPGDHVLDPFAGSGSIFLAGAADKLYVTGIEQDPIHIAGCKVRISEAV